MSHKLPRWVLDDPERGFLYAYYRFIQKAAVSFPSPTAETPVAYARVGDALIAVDFSTHYGPEFRPQTARRRLRTRLQDIERSASVLSCRRWRYDIWCFLPLWPELAALVQSVSDANIRLIAPEQVMSHIVQTFLAVPDDDRAPDKPAFVTVSQFLRPAFFSLRVHFDAQPPAD